MKKARRGSSAAKRDLESRNKLRKRFIFVPLALDHFVEGVDQPGDYNNGKIDRYEVNNFPHGCNLIVLLVIDELALLSMVNDTLLSERQSPVVKVTTKSSEDSLIMLIFALGRPNGY